MPKDLSNVAESYRLGWETARTGYDGRYPAMLPTEYQPYAGDDCREAWCAGYQDAMEAEFEETPDPRAAGYV